MLQLQQQRLAAAVIFTLPFTACTAGKKVSDKVKYKFLNHKEG